MSSMPLILLVTGNTAMWPTANWHCGVGVTLASTYVLCCPLVLYKEYEQSILHQAMLDLNHLAKCLNIP